MNPRQKSNQGVVVHLWEASAEAIFVVHHFNHALIGVPPGFTGLALAEFGPQWPYYMYYLYMSSFETSLNQGNNNMLPTGNDIDIKYYANSAAIFATNYPTIHPVL